MAPQTSDPPPVGTALDALSPEAQFDRKVRVLKVVCIVEAVSYGVLIPLMFRRYVQGDHSTANELARRVVAYFHGMVVLSFAFMAFDVHRRLRWTKAFLALVICTGPVGALIAHARLRARRPDHLDVASAQASSAQAASAQASSVSS